MQRRSVAMLPDARPSRLSDTLVKARRLVDPETGIIKLLHEPALAPDAPRIFGCGTLCSDFKSLGFLSESDVSGSTAVVREQAIAAAVGESVERYSASYVPYEKLRYWPPTETQLDAVEPESIVLYDRAQYEKEDFVFAPLDRSRSIGWIEGYSLTRRQPMWVPAFAVFQPYVSERGEQVLGQQVTTGLACGNTLPEAILSGLCEVVERHASMSAWLARRSLPRVDLTSLPPGSARATLERFGRLKQFVAVLECTGDIGIPSYIAVWIGPIDREERAIFCSCAKPSADAAVAGALRELAQCLMWVESLLARGPHLPDPLVEPIHEIEQHVLWPLNPAMADRYAFLLAGDALVRLDGSDAETSLDASTAIERCATSLQDAGYEAVAIDVTSPDIEEVGLKVARVVIPECQPLFFGSGLERVSPRLGIEFSQVNHHPHPFP